MSLCFRFMCNLPDLILIRLGQVSWQKRASESTRLQLNFPPSMFPTKSAKYPGPAENSEYKG